MFKNFPIIIIDESTDARITVALKNEDYNVISVQETMQGVSDIEIIEFAAEIKGYIITEDKDFGDELVYNNRPSSGALLLRLAGIDINEKIKLILSVLEKHATDLISCFAVLNKNKLRIRK